MAPIDHTENLPLHEREAMEQHLDRFNQEMKALLRKFNIFEYALGFSLPLPGGVTIEGEPGEGATIELINVNGEHLDTFVGLTLELTRTMRDGVDELARKIDRRDSMLSYIESRFGLKAYPAERPDLTATNATLTFWSTPKGES